MMSPTARSNALITLRNKDIGSTEFALLPAY